MEKNLDTTKPRYSEIFCQSFGPSLYRGSTVVLTQNLFYILSVVEFSGQTMGVLREVWNNVYFDLKTIATMREQPVFKTPPQRKMVLRDFDAPVNVGNKYVQRLTSYLQVNPPLTV